MSEWGMGRDSKYPRFFGVFRGHVLQEAMGLDPLAGGDGVGKYEYMQ